MTPNRLAFDDRLLNRYTVEDLAKSHPSLHSALEDWFTAFGEFDDTALAKLIAARGQAEIDKWRDRGVAALKSIPAVAHTLNGVIEELKTALAAGEFPEREQLQSLLDSARQNRSVLLEQAPSLITQALDSVGAYDETKSEAAAGIARTAKKLEDMRDRSADESRSYHELQPLVEELKQTWATLDHALEPLSRQDQRAAREPQDARMREAASTLCRNLFVRKMRDRANGVWPRPEIPDPGDSAPERLAAALARGNFAAAYATFAPWVATAWTVERLQEEYARTATEIAAGFDLPEPPPAGAWEVGSNPLTLEDLRSEDNDIATEVTEENFLGWFPIQILTEEEDAYLTDLANLASLYTVAVSMPDGERIGFPKFEE